MALRHRDLLSKVVDRENINTKPVKAQLTKQISLTRRPALDELSNKLNAQKAVTIKPEPSKEVVKPAPKPFPKPEKENHQPTKSYSSTQLTTIIKPDPEQNDVQMVSEYLDDIFNYLRELETKFPIKENFLEGHQSTSKMRAILVNWLVQVHTNFCFCLETLHMSVSIIDRYLQENKQIGGHNLQLVGTSALLIACKYEEMYFPDLSDYVYICDDAFSKQQILKMEMSILMCLDCNLGKPLSIHFLRRYSKLARVRIEQHNLSKYLLELALLDHTMSLVKPSLQAAAACCLSVAILTNLSCPSKVWTRQLENETYYKYSDLKPIIVKFAHILLNVEKSKHKYITSKYSETKYNKISLNPKLRGLLVKKLTEPTTKV